jgi:hypothetical protein
MVAESKISRFVPLVGFAVFAVAGLFFFHRRADGPRAAEPLQPRVFSSARAAAPLPARAAAGVDDAKPPAPARNARPKPPSPNLKPRAEGEWQGMLVDLSVAPTCETTAHCSMAQVCRAGRCLPCERDGECVVGEVCVLDHCVRKELTTCRSANDCQGVPCVLSGYSSGARNNAETRSYCANPESGQPHVEEDGPQDDPRPEPPLAQRLTDRLRQSLREP